MICDEDPLGPRPGISAVRQRPAVQHHPPLNVVAQDIIRRDVATASVGALFLAPYGRVRDEVGQGERRLSRRAADRTLGPQASFGSGEEGRILLGPRAA